MLNKTVIVGLDISTSVVGYTIIDTNEKILTCNYVDLKKIEGKGKRSDLFLKADFLLDKLYSILSSYNVKLIIIESPIDVVMGANINSSIMLNRFNYMISYQLYLKYNNIRYISSQHARKLFLKDDYSVWMKEPKGDEKKEFIAKRVYPLVEGVIKFEHRPKATTKFKEVYYDCADSAVIALSYFLEK